MGRSHPERLIKILFGRATHCANLDCSEPLIIEHRGALAVNAQIAHIRSGQPGGPRYDPTYPSDLVDCEENLFLACLKCHHLVDDASDLYTVDELLEWKSRQVTQGTGRELAEHEVALIASKLEHTLAALTQVRITVELTGVIHVRSSLIGVPLEHLAATNIVSEEANNQYLGVRVTNEGLVATDIDAVGIDLDIQADEHTSYLFPDDQFIQPQKLLRSKSSGVWIADPLTVGAGLWAMYEQTLRFPHRMRAYALIPGDGRVEGQWVSLANLPMWKTGMTEERLQELVRLAGERRKEAE